MKKLISMTMALILMLGLSLAGCSTASKAPKEALKDAVEASMDMKSSKFEGAVTLNITPPASELDDPETAMIYELLNNAELTFRGTTQADPQMAEAFITLKLNGDLAISINIDMLVAGNKIWIKVPNIPMLPIPAELTGKYIELDMDELNEMSGTDAGVMFDQAELNRIAPEIIDIFFAELDEETYFSSGKTSDVPDGVDAKKVIKFTLTDDSLKSFMLSFLSVLPQMMGKISEIIPDITQDEVQDELEEFEKQIEERKAEFEASFDEIQDSLKINDLSLTMALDSDNFVTYTDVNVDVDITDEGETGTIKVNVNVKQSDINKDQEFELSEPDPSQVIPFMSLLMSLSLDGIGM